MSAKNPILIIKDIEELIDKSLSIFAESQEVINCLYCFFDVDPPDKRNEAILDFTNNIIEHIYTVYGLFKDDCLIPAIAMMRIIYEYNYYLRFLIDCPEDRIERYFIKKNIDSYYWTQRSGRHLFKHGAGISGLELLKREYSESDLRNMANSDDKYKEIYNEYTKHQHKDRCWTKCTFNAMAKEIHKKISKNSTREKEFNLRHKFLYNTLSAYIHGDPRILRHPRNILQSRQNVLDKYVRIELESKGDVNRNVQIKSFYNLDVYLPLLETLIDDFIMFIFDIDVVQFNFEGRNDRNWFDYDDTRDDRFLKIKKLNKKLHQSLD